MRAIGYVSALAILLAAIAPGADFKLAYIGPESSKALQGLRLGIDESNVQGEFLGVKLTLAASPDGSVPSDAIAVFTDRQGGVPAMAEKAGGRAVFNLTDDSDSLRAACLPSALHVIPSARMKADAVSQWKERAPDAAVSAAAWHGGAVKFAARDLNRRYKDRYGTAMDSLAWAGWFAARAVGDTLMREPSVDADGLLRLLKEADGLDGQKGDPHSFRPSGQLRQPLVLVGANGELLGEAPVRGAPGGLDSLGVSPCE